MGALKWVESEGGPLIVLEREAMNSWNGYRGSDYENACEVEDYVGLVEFGERSSPSLALAINDDPLPASFLKEFSAMVQWMAASSEERLVAAVRDGIGLIDDWAEGACMRIIKSVVVFDAALPGDATDGDLLVLDLEPGAYRIKTADIETLEGVCARVHVFEWVSD
ncbi:Imm21 family immunity protein [Streptomyces sp. NPDC005279]|uniref:Imm21 family immunity protein n=1 Tax=Streptomyces sp. NPDC005279 TaxID=3364712 RepID=UPI0036A44630